ncbi:DUF6602 domain-containing protein [Pedobacter sp. CFBP9032]|uniref:DUF6602 domain-containing protein n=1 Tax=Pedobacter sp. CFBP9032 TaxID=3096539 RepID=UPI002A6B4A7C|nr:DUF6602 domain-containing protein [Pedobacter sp. CFBP9032]MDY0906531.1 DUF6602 domain-containing protein [Pedobacter sp. CFBP9032]
MKVTSIKEIIEEVLAFEVQKIGKFKYKMEHRPSIGDQYEAALLNSIDATLPPDSDLRVVTGFIGNKDFKLSGQIDCMLVKGEGEKVPGSKEQHVYSVSDVLMIFEIKKRFFTNDLREAYSHLKEIQEFDRNVNGLDSSCWLEFRKIFSISTRIWLNSYEDASKLDLQNEFIFHELLTQFNNPTRVVFGYYGLKNEKSLRNKLYAFLQKNIGVKGFGPFSLPDMIISNDSCIVKLNGQPHIPLIENDNFVFMASSTGENLAILAEMIAAKISRFYPVDYHGTSPADVMQPFLSAKLAIDNGDPIGWHYITHDYIGAIDS